MKVSVVMAVYNGKEFLERSLNAILPQLERDDEIIIINDASTDDSLRIITGFDDPRIRIHSNPKNQGVNYSFMKGLNISNGDIVCIADQDDVWKTNKIKSIKDFFSDEKLDVLVHNGAIFHHQKKSHLTIFDLNKSGKGFWKNLRSDTYVGCCMAMRGAAKNKLLPTKQFSGVMYDHYLGLMAELKQMNILFTAEIFIDYHRHDTNLTNIQKRRNIGIIVWDRIRLIIMLLINR